MVYYYRISNIHQLAARRAGPGGGGGGGVGGGGGGGGGGASDGGGKTATAIMDVEMHQLLRLLAPAY
jgi:hypothetical protein